jgi:flagellar biosynthetic protein FliR
MIFFNPIQFWLVASRLSGVVLMLPIFSEAPVPRVVKIGLVIWLTMVLTPLLKPINTSFLTAWDLGLSCLSELLLGLCLGYIVRLTFAIFEIGGTIIDTDMGYRLAEQINPQAAISGGIISRFFMLIALFYFWMLDYFPLIIMALKESFSLIPPASFYIRDASAIVRLSTDLFASGLALAAPVLGVMFAINIGVGFLAKSIQGLNMFFEIFTLRILVGVMVIILFLPLSLAIIRDQLTHILPAMDGYLKTALPSGGV